jgi:cold shock CspA family protein
MVTGKVVRFDELKGYGFVAPDAGGEDVFIHVNDLEFDKRLLGPGMQVTFDVEEGDRGLKASHVQLQEGGERRYAGPARSSSGDSPHEDLCDVLSTKEFIEEITEALLQAAPAATSEQILQIRQRLVQIAHAHGWVDS